MRRLVEVVIVYSKGREHLGRLKPGFRGRL